MSSSSVCPYGSGYNGYNNNCGAPTSSRSSSSVCPYGTGYNGYNYQCGSPTGYGKPFQGYNLPKKKHGIFENSALVGVFFCLQNTKPISVAIFQP
jgi:hypothetical protein